MTLATRILALAALQGAAAFMSKAVRPSSALAKIRMAANWDISEITPDGSLAQRIEGKTRKTWKFNDLDQDRVQVALTSEGRPINADVQLWIGPDWTPFSMKAYSEDGKLRPVQTLIGTRNKPAMIEVRNVGEQDFPFKAASNYAKGEMAEFPHKFPTEVQGERVDGGAIRSFNVDPMAEQLEVVLNTEGKQLNARVELLNGPNNPKQTFEVFTNNGQLNSLCVCFMAPEVGTTLRLINLAPVEFPCYSTCVGVCACVWFPLFLSLSVPVCMAHSNTHPFSVHQRGLDGPQHGNHRQIRGG